MSVESSTSFISGSMPDMSGAFPKPITPIWKNPVKHFQEKNASVQAIHAMALHAENQRVGTLAHTVAAEHHASITPEGHEFYFESPWGRTRGFGTMKPEAQLNPNQFPAQDSQTKPKRLPVWDPNHPNYPKPAPGMPDAPVSGMSPADKARAELLRQKVDSNRRQRNLLPTPVRSAPASAPVLPTVKKSAPTGRRGPNTNSTGTTSPGKTTGQAFDNSPVGEARSLTPQQKAAATRAKNKAAAAKPAAKAATKGKK